MLNTDLYIESGVRTVIMAMKKMIVIDIYKQNFLNVAENIVLQKQASEE